MADWNSAQYLKFNSERTQPAIDLANRISVDNVKKIIDIGCGPGNSTAVVGRKFPDAYVVGVDNSENMIETAKKKYPDFDFKLCDVGKDLHILGRGFDIVFSNACIQWVPDHPKLLKELMGMLRKGGVMAVQIPMNFNEPIHKIVGMVSNLEKWRGYFPSKRNFHTLSPSEYFDILSNLSDEFHIWETVYYHIMESHNDILEWYRSTGMRPYLNVLDERKKSEFEADVMERIVDSYPKEKNGKILFRFPRFFFTARATS